MIWAEPIWSHNEVGAEDSSPEKAKGPGIHRSQTPTEHSQSIWPYNTLRKPTVQ